MQKTSYILFFTDDNRQYACYPDFHPIKWHMPLATRKGKNCVDLIGKMSEKFALPKGI